MNEAGARELVNAALMGIKQHRGSFTGLGGSMCALGVLGLRGHLEDDEILSEYGIDTYFDEVPCPVCGGPYWHESDLIVHLNDEHEWDFLAIARKLGPDAA